MEASSRSQETFRKDFDPKNYFDTYYTPGKGGLTTEWIPFALKNLYEIFSSGKVKGDTLMDIGAGPAIYQLLSACNAFKNIITSDFLNENCAQIKKWLRNDPDMLDWSSYVQTVCDMEGNSETCEEKEDKLRRAVKCVLKCDVLKKNPFDPFVLPPVDCLLSCLCLETPCKDLDAYRDVVKNFNDLLKPGGHLIIQGTAMATFYSVGEKRFSLLTVGKEDLEKAFTESGFEILKLEIKLRQDMTFWRLADYQGFYVVHARKPRIV
uniref:Nicotinamide N-methyltransferase n=1 Tax=Leptobrachium leishanense TaxID=445787 RepID=A0A8C5Q0Y7_9ANUR